ncbi:MAG: DUF1684 domain-containing protein [Saprospiraceae bacterium]
MTAFFYTFCLVGFAACTTPVKPLVTESLNLSKAANQQWQMERVEEITSADGWLSLAGLYWLKEGITPFGSDSSNTVVFPANAPQGIGQFILENGQVTMIIDPEVPVKLGEESPKNITLVPDLVGNPTTLTLGGLSWYLIQRENRFGIRLKDAKSPKIKTFKSIEHFPFSEAWQVPAVLKPATDKSTITLRNVIDMDVTMQLEGYLEFEMNGETYQLEALDGGKEAYFIIFADETTGEMTYGAGRKIYIF